MTGLGLQMKKAKCFCMTRLLQNCGQCIAIKYFEFINDFNVVGSEKSVVVYTRSTLSLHRNDKWRRHSMLNRKIR